MKEILEVFLPKNIFFKSFSKTGLYATLVKVELVNRSKVESVEIRAFP
jgi:hypothetical protein